MRVNRRSRERSRSVLFGKIDGAVHRSPTKVALNPLASGYEKLVPGHDGMMFSFSSYDTLLLEGALFCCSVYFWTRCQ